jgi:hypothetical protein
MSSFYSTKFQSPPDEELSDKGRRLAEQSLGEYEPRRRKASDERERKIEDAAERARRKLRDLLGKKNWIEFRKLKERESLAFRESLQPPRGVGLDYEKAGKVRKRRIDAFLREVGVSRERLNAVGREFNDRLKDLIPSVKERGFHLPKHFNAWKRLSPLHDYAIPWGEVAPPDDSDDPSRWFLYRPPFWGFNWHFEFQATSNFEVSREHFLSPSLGLVGQDVRLHSNDTNDFDAAHGIADTQVAVGFVPPVAGRIAVLIDAVCGQDYHYFSIRENEWGFSIAWTNQVNYLNMQVLHPNVPDLSLAAMSTFSYESDDEGAVEQENLVPNQHYYAHLVSAGQVPAGESVVVVAGTRTFHISRADDIRLRTTSIVSWHIQSIEIRVVP